MALQRVLEEMQGYEYMQYIQFNYLEVMSINCKKLFGYSYSYPVFLYVYIIAWKLLAFSTTVGLMYFSNCQGSKKFVRINRSFGNIGS